MVASRQHGRGGKEHGDQQGQAIPNGGNLAGQCFRDHDEDTGDHRGDGEPGWQADLLLEKQEAHQGGKKRHAGLHQQDVGYGGVGKGDDEGSRGAGKAAGNGQARPAHAGKLPESLARAFLEQKETQKEGDGEQGTPEHDCPAFNRDIACDGAAKAPEKRRCRYQSDSRKMVPCRHGPAA